MSSSVSACIICYKQESLIRKAIESAMLQKLDIPYDIIVGDDASPDGTVYESEKLAEQDSRVTVMANKKNLGVNGNWARTINACKGEYIALCEGDDFWTDPLKLKKQIDLLQKNPNASACFSNAFVLSEDGSVSKYPYVDKEFGVLTASEFFKMNFNPIPTCTLVFRRDCITTFPESYYQSPFADWILHTLLFQKGDYLYLPEKTSMYRQHSGGVWSGIKQERQLNNKLNALKIIRSLLSDSLKDSNSEAIRKQLDSLLYFYRERKQFGKYLRTWLELKRMAC